MSVAIRALGLADADMVVELLDILEPGWADALAPGASGATAFVADPQTFMFGAYVDHEPVGRLWGVHVRRPDGRVMSYIDEVDVVEANRRQGIASLLVEAAVAEARQAGSHELWLATERSNAPANALYQSLGGVPDDDDAQVWVWDFA